MSHAQIIGIGLMMFCGVALLGSMLDYGKWSRRQLNEVIVSWARVATLVLWAFIGLLMAIGAL